MVLASAGTAQAEGAGPQGFPTVDRVEFVLECMQRNAGRQEFLYKCACVIDQLAGKYTYDDFVESATAARYQSLAGDRGGEFRDPPKTREAVKRYLQIQSDAKKHCDVPR
jgi:hypothetical protein